MWCKRGPLASARGRAADPGEAPRASAGCHQPDSEYEEAKKKGHENIRRLIREKLNGTSVTIVLIGKETAQRPYVKYEIEQSIARNNGLLGVRIQHLKDQKGEQSFVPGDLPAVPHSTSFPVYDWNGDLSWFRREIEAAGKRADVLRA